MLLRHRGTTPTIHPTAYVAPTAVLAGNVHIGAGARILFHAVLTAEDGRIEIGERSVVMEHALIRARATHAVSIGDDTLVGPHAHINGASVGAGSFLATGCSIFPGARLGTGVEVRINGFVQVNTTLPDAAVVPIGWVAVGTPAEIHPTGHHEEIWQIQRGLDFPGTVYGIDRDTPARERMAQQSDWFAAHRDDEEA